MLLVIQTELSPNKQEPPIVESMYAKLCYKRGDQCEIARMFWRNEINIKHLEVAKAQLHIVKDSLKLGQDELDKVWPYEIEAIPHGEYFRVNPRETFRGF